MKKGECLTDLAARVNTLCESLANGRDGRLKHLTVIDVEWNEASRSGSFSSFKVDHGSAFDLTYASMLYLANLAVKENIKEFGYYFWVQSPKYFNKMLSIANMFTNLDVLSINLPCIRLTNLDDDDDHPLINRINKYVKELRIIAKNITETYTNEFIKAQKNNKNNENNNDDHEHKIQNEMNNNQPFMYYLLNGIKPLCVNNTIASLSLVTACINTCIV